MFDTEIINIDKGLTFLDSDWILSQFGKLKYDAIQKLIRFVYEGKTA